MSIESLCTGAFLVGADLGQRSIGDEPGPSTPCLIFCPRPAHKPAPLSLPSLPQSKRYFACTRTESPGANGGSDHCREDGGQAHCSEPTEHQRDDPGHECQDRGRTIAPIHD